MLYRMEQLYGYDIHGIDGEMGELGDIYFDSLTWATRYFVVDTGGWLTGRQVLVVPMVVEEPDLREEALPVQLTQEQIEKSPEIDLAQPVSEQQLQDLHAYYGWPWTMTPTAHPGAYYLPAPLLPSAAAVVGGPEPEVGEEEEVNPYLRSSREVRGYTIQARDGEIGHIEDFLVDPLDWVIRYLLLDTGGWLGGRKVLMAPTWVEELSWVRGKVYMDLRRETIEQSPRYESSRPVDREYEEELHGYYGRRGYWEPENEVNEPEEA